MDNLLKSLFLFSGRLNRLTWGTLFIAIYIISFEYINKLSGHEYWEYIRVFRVWIFFSLLTSRLRDAGVKFNLLAPVTLVFGFFGMFWVALTKGTGEVVEEDEENLQNPKDELAKDQVTNENRFEKMKMKSQAGQSSLFSSNDRFKRE